MSVNVDGIKGGTCEHSQSDSLTSQLLIQGELEWSKEVRGHVLSSFFYGYIVTQVLGGWSAARYGGKHVFGSGILVTLVATLVVPLAARTHVALIIALRVIMGLACVRIAPVLPDVTRCRPGFFLPVQNI